MESITPSGSCSVAHNSIQHISWQISCYPDNQRWSNLFYARKRLRQTHRQRYFSPNWYSLKFFRSHDCLNYISTLFQYCSLNFERQWYDHCSINSGDCEIWDLKRRRYCCFEPAAVGRGKFHGFSGSFPQAVSWFTEKRKKKAEKAEEVTIVKVEELRTNECWEVLKRTGLGRIACSQDDQPYIAPFEFASDNRKSLYGFSLVGKMIEWMRKNPLVCVEVEDRDKYDDLTTIVIFGRYEELPDAPEFESRRIHAHELLSRRPMWWQSAYVSEDFGDEPKEMPVFFRILVKRIIGHRLVSESSEERVPQVARSTSKIFG